MKSDLFYHGHPSNRDEAVGDLKLKVAKPPEEIERLMWRLYVEYEKALRMTEPFNPLHELEAASPATPATPALTTALTTAQLVPQMVQLAQSGIVIGAGVTEEQLVKLAAAMIPFITGGVAAGAGKIKLGVEGAYLESPARTDVFRTDLTLERSKITTQQGPQDVVKQEVLWQGWEQGK